MKINKEEAADIISTISTINKIVYEGKLNQEKI